MEANAGTPEGSKPSGTQKGSGKNRQRKRAVRYLSVAALAKEAADSGDAAAENELTLSVGSALTYALLDVADAIRDAQNGGSAAAADAEEESAEDS